MRRQQPSRGAPLGVGRALLGVAWVAGWAGLCAWVVWFAHKQAANPREEAMRGWCHLRVRYLYQRLLSTAGSAARLDTPPLRCSSLPFAAPPLPFPALPCPSLPLPCPPLPSAPSPALSSALPCPPLPSPVLSVPPLTSPALPCPPLPSPAPPCPPLTFPAIPCHPLPSPAIPCHPLPSPALPCPPLPSPALPCPPRPPLPSAASPALCDLPSPPRPPLLSAPSPALRFCCPRADGGPGPDNRGGRAEAHSPARTAESREGGEMAALLRVFNGYGPRSSTNLTYWGVAGCANNDSLFRYNLAAMGMAADLTQGTLVMLVEDSDRGGGGRGGAGGGADLTQGTLVMFVEDSDRATVENITGTPILSLLGLPSPRKPHYIVNLLGSLHPEAGPMVPFTDFSSNVPPSYLSSLLQGNAVSFPPIHFNSLLGVGTGKLGGWLLNGKWVWA
ncbi:unnamed protein product [Closterium sp. Naga37s-1]|nr:unnamed protein product [Closterium sp. Naga37s-1]